MENKEPMKVNKLNVVWSLIFAVLCIVLAISSLVEERSYILIWIFFWGAIINIVFLFLELQKQKLSSKSISAIRVIMMAIYIIVTIILFIAS